MKRKGLLYFSVVFLCLLVSCYNKQNSNNNYQFTAKPIVKTVGNIDVMVDPNVEMMMLIGRLASAAPYNFNNSDSIYSIQYIDEIDEYFEDFKYDPVVLSLRNNGLIYGRVPEYGIYLNETVAGYIMDINNKNFIVQTANHLPAKTIPYYASNVFLEQVRNFLKNSNFDTFFIEHVADYEKIIDEKISILSKFAFDTWMEDFYGIKTKEPLCLYFSDLTGGGNFGLIIKNSKGKDIPHAVITAAPVDERYFLYLVTHEFSHPRTLRIVEKLYENKKIKSMFSNLFYENSSLYISQGYRSALFILNETINQACANKFLEKAWTESEMKMFNEQAVLEYHKWIYVPQIAEFLDNYENNRKKYKTLEDFVPELEKFILTLE